MDREALMALAERAEKATGPDRELDWLIAEAVGEVPAHSIRTIGFDYDWYRKPDEWMLWRAKDSEGRSVETWTPKKRTASIDAATTLVPEGLKFEVTTTGYKPGATVCGNILTGVHEVSYAATPASALTAAALRAHAATSEGSAS